MNRPTFLGAFAAPLRGILTEGIQRHLWRKHRIDTIRIERAVRTSMKEGLPA